MWETFLCLLAIAGAASTKRRWQRRRMKLLRIFADPRVLAAFGVLRMVCRSRAHQNAWNYLTNMGFFSRLFHPLDFMMLSTCFCGLTKNTAICPPDPAPTPASGRALSRPFSPLHTWLKGMNIIVRGGRHGQSAGGMYGANPLFHPAHHTRRRASFSHSAKYFFISFFTQPSPGAQDHHDRVLPTIATDNSSPVVVGGHPFQAIKLDGINAK